MVPTYDDNVHALLLAQGPAPDGTNVFGEYRALVHRQLWCPSCGNVLTTPRERPLHLMRNQAFTVTCDCGHVSTGVFFT